MKTLKNKIKASCPNCGLKTTLKRDKDWLMGDIGIFPSELYKCRKCKKYASIETIKYFNERISGI